MPGFYYATCPKCKKRFGWTGEFFDRPFCPNCGYSIPKQELLDDQKELEDFKKYLIERKEKKNDR
jgi:PHP family Zn ribbon phosphoesterase